MTGPVELHELADRLENVPWAAQPGQVGDRLAYLQRLGIDLLRLAADEPSDNPLVVMLYERLGSFLEAIHSGRPVTPYPVGTPVDVRGNLLSDQGFPGTFPELDGDGRLLP